jgi:mono/diheme cytochrome c family protein
MKKILIITGVVTMTMAMMSCNKVRRSPGRAYMPDMYYSRAYETYASTENLKKTGANYTAMPVQGAIARGDSYPYTLPNDSTGYAQSASIKNPLPELSAKDYLEAARLYLVNCGICHGEKLDGNGPLFKGGDGPYTAKPATLVGDPKYMAMPEGTMFHSVTYGKNMMGSYASQLTTKQRWMVIHYIKEKQKMAAPATTATTPGGAKDSTATGPKDSVGRK